jgi:DNA mismatch repair protein MSH6
LIPKAGVDAEYEAFNEKLKQIDEELKQHLREMRNMFNCEVKYIGNDKKRYQIEISEKSSKKVPSNFELTSSRKGFKRYYSPRGKVSTKITTFAAQLCFTSIVLRVGYLVN